MNYSHQNRKYRRVWCSRKETNNNPTVCSGSTVPTGSHRFREPLESQKGHAQRKRSHGLRPTGSRVPTPRGTVLGTGKVGGGKNNAVAGENRKFRGENLRGAVPEGSVLKNGREPSGNRPAGITLQFVAVPD